MSISTTSHCVGFSAYAFAHSSPLTVHLTVYPSLPSRFCNIFALIGSSSATSTRSGDSDLSGLEVGFEAGWSAGCEVADSGLWEAVSVDSLGCKGSRGILCWAFGVLSSEPIPRGLVPLPWLLCLEAEVLSTRTISSVGNATTESLVATGPVSRPGLFVSDPSGIRNCSAIWNRLPLPSSDLTVNCPCMLRTIRATSARPRPRTVFS